MELPSIFRKQQSAFLSFFIVHCLFLNISYNLRDQSDRVMGLHRVDIEIMLNLSVYRKTCFEVCSDYEINY